MLRQAPVDALHARCVSLAPVVLAALVCLPTGASATPLDAGVQQRIDQVFAQWDRWDSPGAALAIERGGELLYARGYGSANLEYGVPITPQTIFHVASVSKQFTDFAVVLLEQEHKLSLDDEVRRYLPWVPDFGRPITLRQLANHTSGLRDQWELLAMAGWRLDDVITEEQILKMVRAQRELNFTPGAEHLYCNTGYTLLAQVVAKVSGESFVDFTNERIFRPLGMIRSHFHADHEEIVPGRAYSYAKSGDGFKNAVLSYANVGATSLFTTAEDLARWLANLDDAHLGGRAAIDEMERRGVLNDGTQIDYALGMVHGTYRGAHTISHGGSDAGFRTVVVRFPEHRLGIVVLSNLGSFDPGAAASAVADVVLGDVLGPAEKRPDAEVKRVELPTEVLDRQVGVYQLDIGGLVTVTRRGDQLVSEAPTVPRAELVPLSEREYSLAELGARITFDAPAAGHAPGFSVALSGQSVRGTRVEPLPGNVLAELTGLYRSPELGTWYRIVQHDDGELVAEHQRHEDIPLVALGRDELASAAWWLSRLKFERDATGAVTGFRVSGGRVRNLSFVRTPETATP